MIQVDNEAVWGRIDRLRWDAEEKLNLFSQRCGIPYSRLSRYRREKRLPNAVELLAIADHLGKSVEYILTGKEYELDRLTKKALTVAEILSENRNGNSWLAVHAVEKIMDVIIDSDKIIEFPG